jgi:hypothetical protein
MTMAHDTPAKRLSAHHPWVNGVVAGPHSLYGPRTRALRGWSGGIEKLRHSRNKLRRGEWLVQQ